MPNAIFVAMTLTESKPTTLPSSSTWTGLLLALGLVIAGWVLGAQIKAIRLSDRFVNVRGLAERQVKSDLAIWTIGYKDAGNELSSVYEKTETDKKTILEFLGQQGLKSPEIEIGMVQVTDTQANEYSNGNRAPYRYIVDQEITVHTARVDQVAAASQKTMLLLRKGIVLEGNRAQNLSYKFTGLNSIKPDMITEGTRNARAAADRFAADSGSRVGSIRQATQGVFSITPADQGAATDDSAGPGASADSSLMKTVRVVTDVEYYLDR